MHSPEQIWRQAAGPLWNEVSIYTIAFEWRKLIAAILMKCRFQELHNEKHQMVHKSHEASKKSQKERRLFSLLYW